MDNTVLVDSLKQSPGLLSLLIAIYIFCKFMKFMMEHQSKKMDELKASLDVNTHATNEAAKAFREFGCQYPGHGKRQ